MKKETILMTVFPVTALVLEALPFGVILRFANPDGNPFITKTSYFDLLPFGYANTGPLITAVLTVALLVILTVYLITGKKGWETAGAVLSAAGFVTSLLPLLFSSYSVIGGLISLCLLAETGYLSMQKRKHSS